MLGRRVRPWAAGAATLFAAATAGLHAGEASASPSTAGGHQASSSHPQPCRDSEDAIIDAPHRLFAAWENGDGDGIAAVFRRHGHMITSNGVYLKGRPAIAAYWNAALAGPLLGTRQVGMPRSVRCLTNRIAVVDGDGGLVLPGETATTPSEVPVERRILVSWVGVRKAHSDTWLMTEFEATPLHP